MTETNSTTTAPPTSKTTSTSTTTQTTTTSTTTTPSRTWRTLSDDFSESTPNDILWTTWAEGDGATYTLANGRLEFTLPTSAQPGGRYNMVGPSLGTRCRFGGDFDAQVDFELLEWPAGAGVHMQLSSWVFPNVNSSAGRQINQFGDQYIGNINQSFTTVPTRDAKGTIRLTRSRGVESAYYRSNGSWVLIQSGTARGQAQLGIQLFAMADEWSRSEVKVAFDNFRVSAPSMTCP